MRLIPTVVDASLETVGWQLTSGIREALAAPCVEVEREA